MNITENFYKILNSLVSSGMELAKNILLAIVAFYLGKIVIRLVMRLVKNIMNRRHVDRTVSKFVINILKISMQVALFIAVIGILGVKTSSIMGLIAATGFGIGLALSGTMQNFANGILLLVFRPYEVGDYIEVNDMSGTVKAIQIFHTILITNDNKVIYIPNGTMGTATTVNHNQQKTRRIDWTVNMNYAEDLDKFRAIFDDIMASEPTVLPNPPYEIRIDTLSDTAVKVILRCWVETKDYWELYYSVNKKIYQMLRQNNIDMPIPRVPIANKQV